MTQSIGRLYGENEADRRGEVGAKRKARIERAIRYEEWINGEKERFPTRDKNDKPTEGAVQDIRGKHGDRPVSSNGRRKRSKTPAKAQGRAKR